MGGFHVSDLVGQTFDGFEILSKLGEGGMAAVYKARQISLNRFVALKVISNALVENPVLIGRFKREANLAAQFKHPHIVQVYAAGESNGIHYMAMELVEGTTLLHHIATQGQLNPQEAITIALQVAEALKYAWDKSRMVHRDIKPSNIFLLQTGEVLVGDLGLAKILGTTDTELTATGTMVGSPHYMSPEQALSEKEIDFRSDIYSLGCTLFRLLAGRTAHEGESSMVLMMKHVHDPPPDIFDVLPGCPRKLGLIVNRMMAREREDRPQSYEELIAELREANEGASGEVEIGRPPAIPPLTATAAATVAAAPPKRTPPRMIGVVVAGAILLLLAGLAIWPSWKEIDTRSLANPKSGEARLLDLGGGVKLEMIAIPPGEFMMGSTKEEQAWAMAVTSDLKEEYVKREGEAPRKATIKQGFWLGRTEVTAGQWKQFVSATGYVTDGEKYGESYGSPATDKPWAPVKGMSWRQPKAFALEDSQGVTCISWNDAVAFCEWLTVRERKTGRLPSALAVRLPTEAEWEYACRAATQTKFWWGESKEDGKDRLNWAGKKDGHEFVAPVDSYGAQGRNGFGLADMLGNVWEWCLDEYDATQAHEEYYRGNSGERVLRGGSFSSSPGYVRCAYRYKDFPTRSALNNGFRVAVGPVP